MSKQPFHKPHRVREKGVQWGWFEHGALERASEIDPNSGLQVYAALCLAESRADPKFKGSFTISRKELARMANVSVRTLTNVLATFQAAKLIEIRSGKKGVNGQPDHANTYRISQYGKRGGGVQPEHQGVCNQSIRGCAKEEADNLPTKNTFSFPLPHRGKGGKERENKNKQKGGEAAPLTPLAADGQRVAGASAKETEPTAAIPMATTQSPPVHPMHPSNWHKLTADRLAEKARHRATIEFLTPKEEPEGHDSGVG